MLRHPKIYTLLIIRNVEKLLKEITGQLKNKPVCIIKGGIFKDSSEQLLLTPIIG